MARSMVIGVGVGVSVVLVVSIYGEYTGSAVKAYLSGKP